MMAAEEQTTIPPATEWTYRSDADRRRAVDALLRDPLWSPAWRRSHREHRRGQPGPSQRPSARHRKRRASVDLWRRRLAVTQADTGDANRRLAGILAADVVGYSAMVGTDEPATLARVRTLRTEVIEPVAATHGGRLFKTTGDGFLVAFASAVQALRCAIAIQERLRSDPEGLRLRIGVHQGEVVAEGDDLLGDGVIIAARLEPLAEPGGICISARVREDAAGKMALEVDDLGEPELKNIAAKIRVFRVRLSAAERPAAAVARQAIAGRCCPSRT